ncbi:amidohydrolase family protein [Ornithinimicrobium sp. Arc0846-15]|nr:amidohydrolase family protein [Ornithinimicrobium laminariae]
MSTGTIEVTGQIRVSPQEVVGAMWVVDGRVTFDRPSSVDHRLKGFVLPGLVDAHCHVGLEATGGVDNARAREHAERDRDAGALLLRDAGSPVDTSWINDEVDLPRLIRAGRHIARTRRYIRNFAHEIEPELLVEYVRVQANRGDGWVKLVGDWIDRETGDLNTCWPRDVLALAIAAAHDEGARVTAHCFGEESLRDFVAAGTDCIEHATGLRSDTIDSFAKAGVAIVPTLVNIENFPDFADAGESKFPTYAEHMRDLYRRRYETMAAARDAGIAIYAGTDAGGQLPHGLIGSEVAEMVKIGMTPLEAINTACWSAREWLGRDGLSEGASADFVLYDADPAQDVQVLRAPSSIVLRGHPVAG